MSDPQDFCQPGHIYRDGVRWAFRCDMITTHPEDGERTALGWRLFKGEWTPYAYSEDDWGIVSACGFSDIETVDGLPALVTAEELSAMRARLAELEALKPAPIQECRKCGAGYDYGQPCSNCAFQAKMAGLASQPEESR
ncbi:hypothetical protein AB0D97_12540 [Streptomyces roseus]|uniref:hypothetical protein n=1 Tax=Streptomyces roseus TaxID=66430 RepID=UPI00341100A5